MNYFHLYTSGDHRRQRTDLLTWLLPLGLQLCDPRFRDLQGFSIDAYQLQNRVVSTDQSDNGMSDTTRVVL
jgi:hypothetical protein